MGLTKITKAELKSWKESYKESLRDLDLENETKHCTLFYSDLKEFVDYIEKRNKVDKKKKIGCVRFYFVRPGRRFEAYPTMESDAETAMKFVYHPLMIKKANSKGEIVNAKGESYPQMRIAMVPMTGVRPNPENSKFAILKRYSENDNDEFLCLFPGTALRKDHIEDDIAARKEKRIKRKKDRVELDATLDSMKKIENDEEEGAKTLKQIINEQDKIENGVKIPQSELTIEPNHRGEHSGACPPGNCDDD